MIKEICSFKKCIGCALCQNVCPKDAISIELKDGFWRPSISSKCIECGNCVRNCPINNKENIKGYETPEIAYAAWVKDDNIHHKSSSGGLAYKLSEQMINSGGFVVGVWFNDETQRVEHRIYDDVSSLHMSQGSKYVSSYKGSIYKTVYENLKEKDGLFIGVPCEVFAMKQYLSTKKDAHLHNLFFIDTLCRGGSSPQLLKEQLSYVSRGKKVCNVTFRGGDNDCNFAVYGENNKRLYLNGQYDDPYFSMFMKHITFQRECFSCSFANSNRQGDITLADFWGLDKEIEKKTPIRGISMIMVNTSNGEKLFSDIRNELVMFERPSVEAINGNDTLREATPMPMEYDEYWNLVNEKGFLKATKKMFKLDCNKHPIRFLYRKARCTAAKLLKGKK